MVSMMKNRDEQAREAATMYYLQDVTMDAVARKMSLSRSTVSRLLSYARESGIVTVRIESHTTGFADIAEEFRKRWGVKAHIVGVPVGTVASRRLEHVSQVAAQQFVDTVQPHDVVGLAWGNTITEFVSHLPSRSISHVTFVQLNGAASVETTGIPHSTYILSVAAQSFGARMVHFPTPAFFDRKETRDAMWRESSIKRVLAIQKQCGTAVFGVGCLSSDIPSLVYSPGYMSRHQLAELEDEGVVGDICTVLLREDGSWRDISYNHRATGPNPDDLQRIKRRICIVADHSKRPAILAALRAHVMTDLYIDDITAKAVLEAADPN